MRAHKLLWRTSVASYPSQLKELPLNYWHCHTTSTTLTDVTCAIPLRGSNGTRKKVNCDEYTWPIFRNPSERNATSDPIP